MSYSADSIVLSPALEAVRRRPGMYVGDPESDLGVMEMLEQLLRRVVALHRRGLATRLSVVVSDKRVVVSDDGPPISAEVLPRVLEELPAGGGWKPPEPPWFCSGYLSIAVSNALSRRFSVATWSPTGTHRIQYCRGAVVEPLCTGQTLAPVTPTGTEVCLEPDDLIFADTRPATPLLLGRLRTLAYLSPTLRVTLDGDHIDCGAGLESWCRSLVAPAPLVSAPMRVCGRRAGIAVDAFVGWQASGTPTIVSLVGDELTPLHGAHVAGLRQALVQRWGTAASKGLAAVLRVGIAEPQWNFSRQELFGDDVAATVRSLVADALAIHRASHPHFGPQRRSSMSWT